MSLPWYKFRSASELCFNLARSIFCCLRICLALAEPPLPLWLRPCLRGDSQRFSLSTKVVIP